MKKLSSILFIVLSSQIALAHPGGHHTHDTLIGAWGWLIVPCIAIVAIIWKFSKAKSNKAQQ
ncbi:hypothetical protein [Formosa algae]|uniref:Uncharacterized protein n=1 Tax=Formosa algae TaxID=225843 RepID=A0A9X0YN04_9FLAO|nr:hypothetical protein [Formosa algae]MBP1839903.1 hypothetical protein [Formosa algae]MDQ0335502.1 hypothetical protein [Formosa algae]OEI81792.1 hypothetical protein AST99_02615 [Formosa algae]PNW26121.1 hypothetical protein BKP44_18085 [Formosa algae]